MKRAEDLEEFLRRGQAAQRAVYETEPSTRVLNGVNLTRHHENAIRAPANRCAACGHWIEPGQAYTLVRLGPGADPVERKRAREGTVYNPVLAHLHWACATGEED